MKKFSTTIVVAAALSLFGGMADATPVSPGTYEIENSVGSHGVWLPGFTAINGWSIQSGSTTVYTNALEFSADVTQNGVMGGFNLKAFLTAIPDPARGYPECYDGSACAHISPDSVDYFDTNPYRPGPFGVLEGYGSLAGTTIELVVNNVGGEKPPQLGLGGAWHAGNEALQGFATWLTWEAFDASGNMFDSGIGDINWLLGADTGAGNPGPAPIPLPAGGLLLIAGLGGMAALRRRARS